MTIRELRFIWEGLTDELDYQDKKWRCLESESQEWEEISGAAAYEKIAELASGMDVGWVMKMLQYRNQEAERRDYGDVRRAQLRFEGL